MKSPQEWLDTEQWREISDEEILELIEAVQHDAETPFVKIAAEAQNELALVDKALALRPALADQTTRFDKIAKACCCAEDAEKLLAEKYETAKVFVAEVKRLQAEIEILKKGNQVTCPTCDGYLPGHATGAADICACDC